MWSPHDIKVLLHHHCVVGEWPQGDTPAYRESIATLHGLGLIDRQDNLARATEKGEALIRLWCRYERPSVSDRYEPVHGLRLCDDVRESHAVRELHNVS